MRLVTCRKCGKSFPSSDLVGLSVPAMNWTPSGGHTVITRPDGVVSPCCHALWDEVYEVTK